MKKDVTPLVGDDTGVAHYGESLFQEEKLDSMEKGSKQRGRITKEEARTREVKQVLTFNSSK